MFSIQMSGLSLRIEILFQFRSIFAKRFYFIYLSNTFHRKPANSELKKFWIKISINTYAQIRKAQSRDSNILYNLTKFVSCYE